MASHPVDPAAFRDAIGLLPTGVTVVTAFSETGPSGATANAVCSLSLEPMLMLVCLDRGSRTLDVAAMPQMMRLAPSLSDGL